MSGSNTTVFGMPTSVLDFSISKRTVFVGAILGILVNMSALLVPILNYVGGGIVAGFVAAYIVGGPRGWLHGVMAGIIAGIVGGFTVAFMGALIGLYTEPPTLMQDLAIGIVSPMFDGMGAIGLLFILLMITAFITIDSIIGGMIGGLLRTLVDTAFRR
jgi:hypothetical protein